MNGAMSALVHKADIGRLAANVRYRGHSGHSVGRSPCPLMTQLRWLCTTAMVLMPI
jgi:hypothetical protein